MKQTKFNRAFSLVRILLVIAVLAILAALTIPQAQAQTIGSGSTVIGITNAPLFPVSTNYLYFSVPSKTLVVSSLNTNTVAGETNIVAYGFQIVGTTNIIMVNFSTNVFTGYTGGTTWTTNFPSQSVAVAVIPYAQANIGSNTNSFYLQ